MRRLSQLDAAEDRGSRGSKLLSAWGAAALTALFALQLWAAPAAPAAETLYWANYIGAEDTIAYANIDGSGGGQFNTTGATVHNPEGMAIDSATGRLFWSSSSGGAGGKGGIFFANLDGSGGGQLNTAGAEVNGPLGVTIDPGARRIYWANVEGGPSGKGSISYANLDGGGGGQLDTSGATVAEPGPMAIDVAGGRVYWGNYEGNTIVYASLSGGGGGALNLGGATPPETITGLAVDPASGRIYWVAIASGAVSYASLAGGGGGDVAIAGATFSEPFGMALDPATARLYWANYGREAERAGAISYASLSGGGGDLNIATAPVDGPQDPVIFKSPSGLGAPQATRNPASRLMLSCSQGTWAPDLPGAFLYQAPRAYSYQWTLEGTAIAGATSSAYTARTPGSYACAVTGSNADGSATQVSAALQVKAAKLALTVKPHKAHAAPGQTVTFKAKVSNKGDFASSKLRICVKAPKQAKEDLKAPKCRPLGAVGSSAKRATKLKVKVGPSAGGSYTLTFRIRGKGGGKPVKAKLIVRTT